jgi:hypothetical protein
VIEAAVFAEDHNHVLDRRYRGRRGLRLAGDWYCGDRRERHQYAQRRLAIGQASALSSGN